MRPPHKSTYHLSLFLITGFLLGFVRISWGLPIITTIAGNGVKAYAGDGGPVSLANLACPDDIALDSHGNMYIADACSDVVRRVDAGTSIITTYAGHFTSMDVGGYSGDGGPATLAIFNYPSGIAFDAQDNLYIADHDNCVIREVNATTGIITTVVGNGTPGYSGDAGPASNAELFYPTLVRFDKHGNMLIADANNNVIREVDATTGIISTVVGFYPGTPGYSGDGGAPTAALLDGCESMITSPSGDLYISDTNNNVIRKVSASTGLITTFVGNGVQGYSGDGGPATLASLDFDNGTLVCDNDGNLFMTDDMNNVIRRVDATTGIITTVAGQGPPVLAGYSGDGSPALGAKFDHTESLCFDKDCNLFVVDYMNNAVRKISSLASSCQPTPIWTFTPTATPTSSPTWTPTSTPTASFTPTVTLSATPTSTPTGTPTPTSSPTASLSATPSSTSTNTATPTLTPTVTTTVTPLVGDIFYVSKNAMRPFSGPVSIYVQYPSAPGSYSLNIYNTAGELVKKLDSTHLQAPIAQSYLWDGANKYGSPCASGMYLLSLSTSFDHKMKRVLIIR